MRRRRRINALRRIAEPPQTDPSVLADELRMKIWIAFGKARTNVRRSARLVTHPSFQRRLAALPHSSEGIVQHTLAGIQNRFQAEVNIEPRIDRILAETAHSLENVSPDREARPAYRQPIVKPIVAGEHRVKIVRRVAE